jgi:hypothetical protein
MNGPRVEQEDVTSTSYDFRACSEGHGDVLRLTAFIAEVKTAAGRNDASSNLLGGSLDKGRPLAGTSDVGEEDEGQKVQAQVFESDLLARLIHVPEQVLSTERLIRETAWIKDRVVAEPHPRYSFLPSDEGVDGPCKLR